MCDQCGDNSHVSLLPPKPTRCPGGRNVFTVWRTLLDETEKLAKARMAAVEVFQQRITDEAKTVRTSKVQTSKKVRC